MILEVFIAGSESTCNSLDWAFLFMAADNMRHKKNALRKSMMLLETNISILQIV